MTIFEGFVLNAKYVEVETTDTADQAHNTVKKCGKLTQGDMIELSSLLFCYISCGKTICSIRTAYFYSLKEASRQRICLSKQQVMNLNPTM